MDKLKKCRCGSKAIDIFYYPSKDKWKAMCTNCYSTTDWLDSEIEAKEAWNKGVYYAYIRSERNEDN